MIDLMTGRDVMRSALLCVSLVMCTACSAGDASHAERPEEADPFPGAPGDPGGHLHASGFEPGWTLDIYSDRMVYVGRYGEERVVTPPPEPLPQTDPAADPKERTWVAHTDAHDIKVRVVEEPCRGPSGRASDEFTVFLSVDGQEYRGCGSRT